ncbi:uncharacterized protein CTRU02_215390 [Colletotrichum truncatum]|uniref:Uncharacterized protein n=1 Tax=Colletotrichum truncatum TaxID=5467 RepID=A0ACC3YD65_COLTU|nr:uncharacterized protein CTRU02_13344 [Colletotrichum truncatum]KAF6783581.1 hypothetical protein CTRU02_13344 [Colletotrichum truncatum]
MTDSEPTEATSPVHDESLKEGLQGGSAGLKFLPVNQFVSPAESTRQRAYLSCDACRQRKTRCVPSGKDKDKRHPCQRCVADNKPCHFRNSRAVGVRRRTGSRKKLFQPASPIPSEGTDTNSTEPTVEPYGVTDIAATSEGTGPPFHPHATSLDSPRDPVLSGTLQSMEDVGLGSQSTSTASPKGNTTAAAQPTARRRIITTRLHDTADALDLLTLTAAGVQSETPHTATRGDGSDDQPYSTSACSAAISSESWPRATNETDWKKVILIKKGVLTKLEVIEYLDFYFNVLWPLRPIVHGFYSDRTRYALLAVEEPLLLTCLVTLASRYHTLQGPYGQIRSERIHWQAWKFLQKYLQSALWGSPLTRSPGAIVAMLLMIEWHSKSINNPLGLSDSDDYELFNVSGAGQNSTDSDADTLSSSTNRQRYGMTTLLEKLNIVAPAYRSNKMSW